MPESKNLRIINKSAPTEQMNALNDFLKIWGNQDDFIFQNTSGSTGKPKAIQISKWKMTASAKMTRNFLDLERNKTALICMSLDYIGGKMMVIRALTYQMEMIITAVNHNPLKEIETPIELAAMVPLQVQGILNENPEKLNLIKYLIIGGAPLAENLIVELKKYNCQAYLSFGMTETVSHIALRDLKKEKAPYKAIGNTSFTTKDDCLVITNEELQIDSLKTNDIVELIDSKSFYWKGRADFAINSGGVKIHPEELEKKISRVIGSDNFIITSIPDESLGQKVVFIGENILKNQAIEEKISGVLRKYERPKAYYFLPSLIKTPSGKVDRIRTTQSIL